MVKNNYKNMNRELNLLAEEWCSELSQPLNLFETDMSLKKWSLVSESLGEGDMFRISFTVLQLYLDLYQSLGK